MLSRAENPVAWTMLLIEMEEAHEHLRELLAQLRPQGPIDDYEFAVHLGHVYAHLNRAWHARHQVTEITEAQWEPFSQFPVDVRPVG